jgi:CRP-like cAMP-binding protein
MQGIAFLQNLGPLHATPIALMAQLQEYPEGTVLFREGQKSPFIYFVLRGVVTLEVQTSPGKTVPVHTVCPGESLGWSPVLGLPAMTATARTKDWCRLAALPVEKLLAFCEKDPRFGMAFMGQIAVAMANRLRAARLRFAAVGVG